jgi:phosphohistidine phosphatase
VIGHNPGLEQCAQMLAREPAIDEEREFTTALREKFPTCALAVLDFDVSNWDEATSGALTDFARPKDIKRE